METVHELPKGLTLPPIRDLIDGRPTSWTGMPVEWSSLSEPVPVFLRKFEVPRQGGGEDDVYLFGARYNLSEALVGGDWLGEGFFIEYFAVDKSSSAAWAVHRLLQRASVTYSDSAEDEDYLPASDVAEPAALSLHAPPVWKASEAVWPTSAGSPMRFVGQMDLPDNAVTREHLAWGETIYLFSSRFSGRNCYKIVEQDRRAQTAEEHYELEQRLNQKR